MAAAGWGSRMARIAADLREEFGRPAMNRRILHRLATTEEADLTRLGLTAADVREAAGPGVADAASFLTARRAARSGGADQVSRRRRETICCE